LSIFEGIDRVRILSARKVIDLMEMRASRPVQGQAIRGPVDKLKVDGVAVTRRTRLELPENLSIEAWKHVGEQIFLIINSSAWWIGDWLLFGKDKYPNRYKRAMQETALDYQTLRNYAWVAGRFSPSRRRDGLSFQHHIEVASLPDSDQDGWLDRAAASGWSRNEFRAMLRAGREEKVAVIEAQTTLQLKVSKQRKEDWEEAAYKAGHTFTEWAAEILDAACPSDQGDIA
jgi:hypothetical protein